MNDKEKDTDVLARIEQIEKEMKAKDEKITSLENQVKEYQTKLATAKVDSLARKVEETTPQQPVDEEITFDFDI